MQTFGGKGANQAVAAARAGGQVAMVNCVGDDRYGAAIRDNLRDAGIDIEGVFTESGVASGTALVMIGDAGDNYLSVAPGANYCLTRPQIDRCLPLIVHAAMIVLQCEILSETLQYAIEIAAEHRRPIMLNLAPARPLPDACLQKLTYLIVNESEAQFLSETRVDSLAAAQAAAQAIRAKGPEVVIVTLGSQGACVCAGETPIHVPAFSVPAVDATAAGDVFCGSLATALVEGRPLAGGVRFASAAAAIAVTRLGAQPSIPRREEIDRFLRERG
jgi:ribokinase